MTAIVVNGATPFGSISNQIPEQLHAVNELIVRLQAAAAAAASGYGGTAGTEFEGSSTNFGVVADATPGQQGASWLFAVNSLAGNWATFWSANVAYVNALDNG